MERIYTIPLRKKTVKTAKYKRSPKAIRVIRGYLQKHMKSDDIKLSKEINEYVWDKGIKNPPGKIKVKAVKDDAGKVTVTLEKEAKTSKSEELRAKGKKTSDSEVKKK